MKIVFVEVQPWEKEILEKKFSDATFVDHKLTSENVDLFRDTEVLSSFINSELKKEVLERLPALKYIAIRSTGYDNIDLAYTKEKNIPVSNVPEYGSNTVAEFAFGLLLDVTRKITPSVMQAKQVNFDHRALQGMDLCGKTLGIVGFGKIGKNVLKIAQGFEMNVIVYNRSQDPEVAKQLNFTYVDLDTLIKTADVVTLHLPLTPETKNTINKDNILNFKKGSILINTARGGLVETQALVLGLEKDILWGVGLDVLEDENELAEETLLLHEQSQSIEELKTLLYDHILLNHPKVITTPHNAFNSREAIMRILTTTTENIEHFQSNNVQNLVK